MWGAIVALRGRYPEQLQALKDKWWTDESTTETLAALAAWRAELDETRQAPATSSPSKPNSTTTPNSYAKKGGGVTKLWKPSATPPEWAGK
jgi:hypothetical protein